MRTLIATLIALTSSSALAAQCNELPVLFVVQDKSGSMAKAGPNGQPADAVTNPSKWSIARDVVPSLATQFSNRFRFGAEMYPTETVQFSCSNPTVMAQVSDLPSGVLTAYQQAVPGGGTPTAVALTTARTYLLGLGLTTPTYVLLITDGLPNCNEGHSLTNCVSTNNCTPESNGCGFGAKDCLDDVQTAAAARALFQSNIKVFVVGFGSDTAGNNKAVLDGIAAAGGTTSAYSAMNKAELTQVLNTIALNQTTCCNDACTSGTRCAANGQLETCTYDPVTKCKGWVPSDCPNMSSCKNGSCVACTNKCTLGATTCDILGNVEQCVKTSTGCTDWSLAEICSFGELCSAGQCGSCQSCTAGATRCGANGLETCEDTGAGCTQWKSKPCSSGSTCQGGSCVSCNKTCTAGTKRCNGKGVEVCTADSSGCTRWVASETCTTFCSGGACGTCGSSCKAGDTQCNGAGVETCIIDSNGCPAWGPAQQCAPDSYCGGGICNECGASCMQGAKRCSASGAPEECQLNEMGCTRWVAGACKAGSSEKCVNGACCADACTTGARQCSLTGIPQTCALAESGCTVWKDDAACGAKQHCIDAICRNPCADDEFQSCEPGTICTGTSDGAYCLPDPDGGVIYTPYDAGSTGGKDAGRADAGAGGLTNIGATAMGCGCTTVDGLLPFALLSLLALRRSKRA